LSSSALPASASRRSWLFGTIACLFGIFLALLLLEVALRFLPVREPLEAQPVTREEPYLHFKPNNAPLFSMGWNFAIVNRLRVNNYGFVNDQDYDPTATSPLLAVIGDSYVEAAQVPYAQTLHGRLAALVAARGRVYSFASSGSPLSQYLAYARLARERFRAQALAIVVVGNDFDESLAEYGEEPGFHQLRRSASGSYELALKPFAPPLLHRIVRRSALIRYVHGNGFVDAAAGRLRALFGEAPQFVGNVTMHAEPERIEKSRAAIDYFLSQLPQYSGIPAPRIVLIVDGERPHLYDAAQLRNAQSSYFSTMRRYLIERATASGYRVADLQPLFIERHARDGTRFEWPIDAHWNASGHEEAARAVVDSGLLRDVFGVQAADSTAAVRSR
jgi:hypothetical protein